MTDLAPALVRSIGLLREVDAQPSVIQITRRNYERLVSELSYDARLLRGLCQSPPMFCGVRLQVED